MSEIKLTFGELVNGAVFICHPHLMVKKSATIATVSDGVFCTRSFKVPKKQQVFLIRSMEGLDHNGIKFEFKEVKR